LRVLTSPMISMRPGAAHLRLGHRVAVSRARTSFLLTA
jgi:hypothetical protein